MAEHDDWVEIKHPKLDGTTRVSPASVKHWESRGWTPASKEDQKKAAEAAPRKEGNA